MDKMQEKGKRVLILVHPTNLHARNRAQLRMKMG